MDSLSLTTHASPWADPRVVFAVAAVAVLLLVLTVWFLKDRRRKGRAAGLICLGLSIALHVFLLCVVPLEAVLPGGILSSDGVEDSGSGPVAVALVTDPRLMQLSPDIEAAQNPRPDQQDLPLADTMPMLPDTAPVTSTNQPPTAMEPKGDALRDPPADDPASEALQQEVDQMLTDLVGNDWAGETPNPSENPTEELTDQHANNDLEIDAIPIPPLAGSEPSIAASNEAIDASEIPDQISPASVPTNDPPTPDPTNEQPWNQTADHRTASGTPPTQALEMPARASTSMIQSPTIELMTNQQSSPVPQRPQSSVPTPARIVSTRTDDFAMRSGDARNAALQRSGGDAQTQAAVESALRFLADRQQPDGSWSPSASAAGQERRVLGIDRGAVGARATNGITALALLTMLGAGNTHTDGPYASSVHAGVSYLIRSQRSDGFVGGNPSPLSRTYCHGMATLALCEIAAMTKDPLAVAAATAALNYSMRTQHHRTGGWRYTPGDTGDLSQLGWQAMALQSGQSADIPVTPSAISGIDRFLRSVRRGRGGLACYRPGEAPSRTMTAEALATRLLMRQPVPESEMEEATRYLLQQTPGVGQDNYYYWYYASLALHQVGGPGWMQWNQAMKQRLLQTQRADGSWNTASVWGGYGGEVYTTSMAALCLEVYYRHVEQGRLARTPSITLGR